MRLDANGNPVYYLTDGMGSVIGMADGAGTSTAKFGYDTFGGVRSTQGVANADAMGGDFRFQGQWLEFSTGLYNFRARDYDSKTGTFLSRDPVDSTAQDPEALNPYQFVYNNPYVYSDPTGMFTLTELNSAQSVQNILQAIGRYSANQAREYLIDQARGIVGNVLQMALSSLLPGSFGAQYLNSLPGTTGRGNDFEDILKDSICPYFRAAVGPYYDRIWLGVRVDNNSGRPLDDGIGCGEPGGVPRGGRGAGRPDFIFKQFAPTRNHTSNPSYRYPKAWLIGDVTFTLNSARQKMNPNETQWQSIYRHAQYESGFQYAPLAMYITFRGGTEADEQAMRAEAARRHVIAYVLTVFD